MGQHTVKYNEDIWGSIDYRILKCAGCNTVYFQSEEVCSEGELEDRLIDGEYRTVLKPVITHFPIPVTRKKPEWSDRLWRIDSQLRSLFDDLYIAIDNSLNVLAAIGIRTTFDRASELLGVDPAKPFVKKLEELTQKGIIGGKEHEILDTLTDAGNAAAHRGWRPDTQELDTLMAVLETFIHRAFILGDATKDLRSRVPARPKRTPSRQD
jgi:hypothetical protein